MNENRMKELETKYVLVRGENPGGNLRRLLEDLVWAGFHALPKGTRLIHDVYYDSADQRLRRAGWSCRSRRRGARLQLTCKQLTDGTEGFFERQEIEQSILQEQPVIETMGDGAAHDLLLRYLPSDSELIPLFRQTNRRTSYLVSHPDYPRAAIELVMDRVHIEVKDPLTYVEFEGELKQGPASFLSAFADVMCAQPGCIRSHAGKFHRGLFQQDWQAFGGSRKRELMSPDDQWSKLGASYLADQFEALTAYAPYAREGIQPEGIHQMRVVTRRLRAALKAFRDVLPRKQAGFLAGEARWLCEVLGAVRDLDVHMEHVERYRRKAPKARSGSLDAYERHLDDDHRLAHRCFVRALESRRYADFLKSFAAFNNTVGSMTDDDSLTIQTFARSYLPGRLRSIRKAGRKISSQSKDKEMHRLRIRIKRLRYQLEILEGPYGKSLRRASRDLRRLQGRLGDHQDACVAQLVLKDYRDNQASGRREKRTFDWLIETERDRATSLKKGFQRDWKRFEAESHKLQKVF